MRSRVLRRAVRNARGYRVALAIVFLLVTQTPIISTHPGTLIGRTNAAQQISLAVPLQGGAPFARCHLGGSRPHRGSRFGVRRCVGSGRCATGRGMKNGNVSEQ